MALMTDQGPARRADRAPPPAATRLAMMAGGQGTGGADRRARVLRAGHHDQGPGTSTGFLFDAGTSPDGVTENMRPPGHRPVLDRGHRVQPRPLRSHPPAIDGLIRAVGRVNLPVLIHPPLLGGGRRLQLPGREPQEIPTTSRSAPDRGRVFDVIEERPAQLPVRAGPLLITGEVPPDHGLRARLSRPQQAWLDGSWQAPTRWCSTTRRSSSTSVTGGPGGDHRLRPRRAWVNIA